jgi:hypothetical protein
VDKIFNHVIQEKAVREILKKNLERIVGELKTINPDNTSDLTRKEEVEIETETEMEVQQELQLEQELEQLRRTFSSDGKSNAHRQEILPAPNGRENPAAWVKRALGKGKEQRAPLGEPHRSYGRCRAFGKNTCEAFASLFNAASDLLVSEDFVNTAADLITIFDPIHKTSNHILLLPNSQKYFFVSQSDADQIKIMVVNGQLPRCVLLASSGNLELGKAGAWENLPPAVKTEAIWSARFFKGDIDFLEANEDLTKQMLNQMFTSSKKPLEAVTDTLHKFILLRDTAKMSDAINIHQNRILPIWQPEKPATISA